MTGRLLEKARAVQDRSAFLVRGREDEPADTGETDCACAHRAWLKRHVKRRSCQPVIANCLRGGAKGSNLGMRGRIVCGDRAVAALSQHGTGLFIADNCSDRHLASFGSLARQLYRTMHHLIVSAHRSAHTPKPASLHAHRVLRALPMRIISGRYKGQALSAPKGRNTRPTSDRARESLFNVLAHASWAPPLEDARVIDLFAGSGALGFEAMSRGAAFCLFVETDSGARGAIRDNVEAFQLFGNTRIHRRSATDLGPKPAGVGQPFTLAFLDPPYHQGLVAPCLQNLLTGQWLAEEAIAVVETDAKEDFEHEGWEVLDERSAGKARLTILRPA